MRERPILMSAPMVRAILDGRKTQTRRVMRPQPPAGWFVESPDEVRENDERDGVTPRWLVERCPHGRPGDRLWLKETIRRVAPAGRGCAVFAADNTPTAIDTWPWKRDVLTAIHTPRGASRITLEITEVRVQRLQEISEDDARAEGIEPRITTRKAYPSKHAADVEHRSYRGGFEALWDSINGKRASWQSNPWVWAISFTVVR